jgi:hypothetical protein
MYELPRLRFRGTEYVLVNDDGNRREGAITTRDAYEAFDESFAHLFASGAIKRHGTVIGHVEDIEWIEIQETA